MTEEPGGEAQPDAVLHAMSDAILAIASEASVQTVLQRLVESARELAHARYAALGVPDEDGGETFAQFIYTGMSGELVADIGPLPRRHGLLAAMLGETKPYRAADIRQDPRFQWWPDAHPRMSSFLGVPIVSKGRVIGAFYLTDKMGARQFSEADERTIVMLAAHAAVAMENARLYERSRELTVVEERNRLARDLHDSVVQTLFSMSLTAEAAAAKAGDEPETALREVERLRDLARAALQEMRSLVFELRPDKLESEGLLPTLKKHIDVLRRVTHKDIELREESYSPQPVTIEKQLFRIIQEGLNNAVKHSRAEHVGVEIGVNDGRVAVAVSDDGVGFDPSDPAIRTRRLGITSMEERAHELGGELRIDSAPEKGTRVSVEVSAG